MIEDYRIQSPVNTFELNNQENDDNIETTKLIEQQNKEKSDKIAFFFINENKLSKSPEVEIEVKNGIKFRAILDSGSEVNLLSERVYEQLIKTRAEVPVLPLENVVLVTAFGRRSRKMTRQALLEFAIGEDDFEGVFMISPQLANEAIIGSNC
jgi:hypothetical protein